MKKHVLVAFLAVACNSMVRAEVVIETVTVGNAGELSGAGAGGWGPNRICGNGLLEAGEECDDGNIINGDGCEHDCTLPNICGDGFLNPSTEECDDGNTVDGDGCRGDCALYLSIDTVPVGNVGNAEDEHGYGRVDYFYRIGKFEVTAGQYLEFLNAVAGTDTHGSYNPSMNVDAYGCQITQNCTGGTCTYDFGGGTVEHPNSTSADWQDRPVNFVSWADAARFCNWLHNGQPIGGQDRSSTEDGSYDLAGASDADYLDVGREEDATWVILSSDEWHKAAYHKNDGTTGNYWDYPTQSDMVPTSEVPPGTDMTNGSANFDDGDLAIGPPYYRTEVGAYNSMPSDSPYGTFDQAGNVWELVDGTFPFGSGRVVRGGSFSRDDTAMRRTVILHSNGPTYEGPDIGFRVARIHPCVVSISPPACAIDARYPFDPGNVTDIYGWDGVDITGTGNCTGTIPEPEDLTVSTVPTCPAPTVTDVTIDGVDTVTIHLSGPISPGCWTCIANSGGEQVCMGYLPGDVGGDGASTAADVLVLIDHLNDPVANPLNQWQCDLDRSGACHPPDVLGVIDLLNGAGPFAAWNNVSIPACPSARPQALGQRGSIVRLFWG